MRFSLVFPFKCPAIVSAASYRFPGTGNSGNKPCYGSPTGVTCHETNNGRAQYIVDGFSCCIVVFVTILIFSVLHNTLDVSIACVWVILYFNKVIRFNQ